MFGLKLVKKKSISVLESTVKKYAYECQKNNTEITLLKCEVKGKVNLIELLQRNATADANTIQLLEKKLSYLGLERERNGRFKKKQK